MWQLQIRGFDEQASELSIPPGRLTIGRHVDNDVVFADSAVSRNHARIEYRTDDDLLLIEDLASANGTFVNQFRLAPHEPFRLTGGDRIRIGLHVLTAARCMLSQPGHSRNGATRGGSTALPSPDTLDSRADLLYQVAQLLNTASDPRPALGQVTEMVKEALQAQRCLIILEGEREISALDESASSMVKEVSSCRHGVVLPGSVAGERISAVCMNRPVLCVPVLTAGDPAGVIYLDRAGATDEPFGGTDLKLVEAISHMVALILERLSLSDRVGEEKKLRNLLHSYLSSARVEDLLQNYLRTGRLPGLAEQQATVLFADIADSTKMAERLGARLFGESLQRYYEDMTQIVSDHGGFLEKYLGDGVMAVFGLADGNLKPEKCAVLAGLSMLDFIESHDNPYAKGIHIGVGVNSGPVVAGYVKTRDRVDFTILGDTVNVAHGLQSLARPNRLLVGPTTCDRVTSHFQIRNLGTTVLKGREGPVQVHEVLRQSTDTVADREAQSRARNLESSVRIKAG
jgi:adenylate cyclase